MTKSQKYEAIQALVYGEYDNPYLIKIGALYPDFFQNVTTIIAYPTISE